MAIKRVMSEDAPTAAEKLLRRFPAECEGISERALTLSARGRPWYGLLLAVSLARCGAPQALDLLRHLVSLEFLGWHHLGEEALRSLQAYLLERGEASLFHAVRQRLDGHQLGWVLPDVDADGFVAAIARGCRQRLPAGVVWYIAQFVEEVGLGRRPPGQGLDNAAAAAEILWQRGQEEESVLLLALLALTQPVLFEEPKRLRPVADALPGWIPSSRSLRIEGLPDGVALDSLSLPIAPVPPRVVRAADLLAEFPRFDWIESLRSAWLAVEDLVRRDAREEEAEHDPQRLMAAQSIAAALGACAALDREMRVLVRDENKNKRRHEDLRREVDQRNKVVVDYQKLVAEFHAGKEIQASIRKLREQIGTSDAEIARKREDLRRDLTPAALLLHAVSDEQAYPLEVRQGAAWGLYRILEGGALEGAARDRVHQTLRSVLHGEEFDESAVRDRIAAALPPNDERIRELLIAAERYGDDRDAEALAAAIAQVAPGLPALAEAVREVVDATRRPRERDEFGERIVRLLPGARLLELVGSLRRGLRWMVELIEGRAGGDPSLEGNLRWIVALTGKELAGVTEFIKQHPLRLMTLNRHRRILGQYCCEKVHLSFWTRYTPPRWFRGADPAQLGEVHRRYLQLEDRSTPNSMGVYYRLFEHPLLVLPVLYHEFLHYGGPRGEPDQGIENETEVLLRETLFGRYLVAKLSPTRDEELPAYEAALAATIDRADLVGFIQRLFFDFEDDVCLSAINEEIIRSYGEVLSPDAAKAEVARQTQHWNRTVELENLVDEAKLSWCPDREWPLLGTEQTRALTDRFQAVVSRLLVQDHRLDPEQRDHVLTDPVCRHHRDCWAAYTARPGAAVLLAKRSAQDRAAVSSLRAILHRYNLEPRPAEILRLFGSLLSRTTESAGELDPRSLSGPSS
ncbi:MAG: hypothetical protein HY721_24195 [Planctomycetes bacterium]|nr:hypothetical protein [Planctomycetota bacterium]